jgi:hypothetical protein
MIKPTEVVDQLRPSSLSSRIRAFLFSHLSQYRTLQPLAKLAPEQCSQLCS